MGWPLSEACVSVVSCQGKGWAWLQRSSWMTLGKRWRVHSDDTMEANHHGTNTALRRSLSNLLSPSSWTYHSYHALHGDMTHNRTVHGQQRHGPIHRHGRCETILHFGPSRGRNPVCLTWTTHYDGIHRNETNGGVV